MMLFVSLLLSSNCQKVIERIRYSSRDNENQVQPIPIEQSSEIANSENAELKKIVEDLFDLVDSPSTNSVHTGTMCLGNSFQTFNKCLRNCNEISKLDEKTRLDKEIPQSKSKKLKLFCKTQYCPTEAETVFSNCMKRVTV